MKPNLQNFEPAGFMRNYWQKKPQFLPAALPANFLSLSSADLFKLAGRAEVESRLISRNKTRGHWRYTANEGPFARGVFSQHKNSSDWTLLVQRVNEWLPHIDLLFEYFSFVANWRIDDIMVSYAATGGTVGAHLDNYDVFLCQLKGERTWQFSERPSAQENLEPNQPVRLLTDFRPDKTVRTRPGDVLYIPPRFAHYGVADTECITVSVGFRAPRLERLMGIFFDEMMPRLGESFYTDKGAKVQTRSGQFSEAALQNIITQAKTGLHRLSRQSPTESLRDALLRDLSQTPNAQLGARPRLTQTKFAARWRLEPLQRNPRNQYFYRVSAGTATLYSAGESFALPASQGTHIAELCNARIFPCTPARLKPQALEFWYEMFSLGFVFFAK
ncbi:MAG: cupin domain-containing protein [Turneriella sp.]